MKSQRREIPKGGEEGKTSGGGRGGKNEIKDCKTTNE